MNPKQISQPEVDPGLIHRVAPLADRGDFATWEDIERVFNK